LGRKIQPIVPIINNILPSNWEKLIEFYDPDFIGYSCNINIEYIETICEKYEFNPIATLDLDDSRNRIEGVYSANLIPHIKSYFDEDRKFLKANNTWKIKSHLKDYYKLNYLLCDRYVMDREILGNHSFVEINKDNFESINKILFENKI
jgi:hypothetical protein